MKKLVIGAIVTMIHACAHADTYVFTPQGMSVIMPAGGKDVLINNPNGNLTLCTYSSGNYICGE